MQRDLNDAWLRTLETPTAGRVEIRDTRVSGLILRMTGHDPLQLRPPSATSLWKTPVGKTDPASYLRQS